MKNKCFNYLVDVDIKPTNVINYSLMDGYIYIDYSYNNGRNETSYITCDKTLLSCLRKKKLERILK